MLLYTIASIPLIELINDNRQIKGITTKLNNTIKIQMYADDSTLILQKPQELQYVLQTYKIHSDASKAKINQKKHKYSGSET